MVGKGLVSKRMMWMDESTDGEETSPTCAFVNNKKFGNCLSRAGPTAFHSEQRTKRHQPLKQPSLLQSNPLLPHSNLLHFIQTVFPPAKDMTLF